MSTESYTRITASRIFEALNLEVDFDIIDKVITRSRGFCHNLIKELAIFTSLKQQIEYMSHILDLNQEIIVDIIFKHQTMSATQEIPPSREKNILELREYSEKIMAAIDQFLDKLKITEAKYMDSARSSLKQWYKKQQNNAEMLSEQLIAKGKNLDDSFTDNLSYKLFFEICNEKSFNPEKQVYFALEEICGTNQVEKNNNIPQMIFDIDKTKSQLLQPFQHLGEKMADQQVIVSELYQRIRALCSATKDLLLEENPNNEEYQSRIAELLDIASDPAKPQHSQS